MPKLLSTKKPHWKRLLKTNIYNKYNVKVQTT